ncbi:hypothetical protein Taro_029560 [Colocasia esculenta]|uniref:WRKY domain-containing protein n=1 Tax=Colocasia esculenta TaxID=4460 RepID=A0A843VJ92_COLES|nr:hypothetical protein [Colocasia esculenta]
MVHCANGKHLQFYWSSALIRAHRNLPLIRRGDKPTTNCESYRYFGPEQTVARVVYGTLTPSTHLVNPSQKLGDGEMLTPPTPPSHPPPPPGPRHRNPPPHNHRHLLSALEASPMAEAPSSRAPEQRAGRRDEGGRPPTSPPPPPSPPTARTEESPPPSAATKAAKSSSPDPTVSSSSAPSAGAAGENCAPRTLAITVPVVTNSDLGPDGAGGSGECRRSFSQLLAGAMASPLGSSIAMPIVAVPVDAVRVPVVAVPCFLAPAALLDSSGFTGQFAMTHQAVLATVTAQAQIQLQSGYAPSPTIPTIAPVPTEQSPPSASEDNVPSPKAEQRPSFDQKLRPVPVVLKTTLGDKFNWRKYGQKQVKSSESSRSYYRCTQANCSAKKKVECCQDGRVIEVIYKGGHNHDPPQKVKCSKERRRQSIAPSGDNEILALEGGEANESIPSQSKVEQDSGSDTPEQQLHCSSDCEADASIKTEEDLDEEPDLKRRLTERPLASPSPRFKSVKEPKVVVQKACDGGPSSDGYRWRKYGQKLVKGNPNPRLYASSLWSFEFLTFQGISIFCWKTGFRHSGVEYHISAPMSEFRADAHVVPGVMERLNQLFLRIDQMERQVEEWFTESERIVQGMANRLVVLERSPAPPLVPVHPPGPRDPPRADHVVDQLEDDHGYDSFGEVEGVYRPAARTHGRFDRQLEHEWDGDRRHRRYPLSRGERIDRDDRAD